MTVMYAILSNISHVNNDYATLNVEVLQGSATGKKLFVIAYSLPITIAEIHRLKRNTNIK